MVLYVHATRFLGCVLIEYLLVYINLPIGAVAFAVIVLFFHSPPRKSEAKVPFMVRLQQFDFYGTAVFLPDIVCLLLALQWGGSKYPWSDGRIIALLVLFGVLTAAFVCIQFWKKDNATIPPRLLKQRSVAGSVWFSFCLGGSFFVLVYWLPIWFQAIKGTTAEKSGKMILPNPCRLLPGPPLLLITTDKDRIGIDTLPMIIALVVANIVSGIGTTKIGYYTPFFWAATILQPIGLGLLTTFEPSTNHSKWIGYQVLYGFGVGFGMQQAVICAQTVLPLHDIPVGTAMMFFFQTLGGALMISVGQNVFDNELIKGITSNVPGVDARQIVNVGATSLQSMVPARFLSKVLQVYNDSLTTTWYVAVAMAAMSLFGTVWIEWKSVKAVKTETVPV